MLGLRTTLSISRGDGAGIEPEGCVMIGLLKGLVKRGMYMVK